MLAVPLKNHSNHGFSGLELNNRIITSVGDSNYFTSRDYVRVSDLGYRTGERIYIMLLKIFMKLRKKQDYRGYKLK